MTTWTQSNYNGWWNQYENNWVGIQVSSTWDLIGGTPTSCTFFLKKTGSPTFDLYVDVYASDDSFKFSSNATSASTLDATGSDIEFTFTGASAFADGDYIMLRTVPNTTNYIWMGRQTPPADSSVSMQYSNSPWSPGEISTMTPRMSVTATGAGGSSTFIPPPPAMVKL